MTDRAFRRNLSANLVAHLWMALLPLLLTPAYVHFLGVEAYGLVGFYATCVAMLAILDTGISATATRETAWLSAKPEGEKEIPALLRTLEVSYWVLVGIVGSAMLVGAWLYGDRWFNAQQLSGAQIRQAMMLMAVALFLQAPGGLYAGGLMGLQKQALCAGLLVVFGTFRGVGALFVVWGVTTDLRAFFVWQILVSAAQTGTMAFLLWRHISRDASFSLAKLRSIRGFASAMLLITALSTLVAQGDKLILSRTVPLEALGMYMLAWSLASGFSRIAAPIIQTYGPRFTALAATGDLNGLAGQARGACNLMNVLIVPAAVLVVAMAQPILFAWTGNRELAIGTAPILALMAAGVGISSCSHPALSILYSRNQLRLVVATNVLAALVLLPLLLIASIRFGATGAAGCWALYGLITYVVFQHAAIRPLCNGTLGPTTRDLATTLIVSITLSTPAVMFISGLTDRVLIVGGVAAWMLFMWVAAALSSDLLRTKLSLLLHGLRADRAPGLPCAGSATCDADPSDKPAC